MSTLTSLGKLHMRCTQVYGAGTPVGTPVPDTAAPDVTLYQPAGVGVRSAAGFSAFWMIPEIHTLKFHDGGWYVSSPSVKGERRLVSVKDRSVVHVLELAEGELATLISGTEYEMYPTLRGDGYADWELVFCGVPHTI